MYFFIFGKFRFLKCQICSYFQSSNLKTKAEQARARTDNINSDAMETRRQLNEDIIPNIERGMADVERVTQINKMAKHNDEQIVK